MRPYADRQDAGRVLAAHVLRSGVLPDGVPVVVLGLPRGGVPVAVPVARALGAPLGVVLVRKLGLPWQPELAMGAVARIGDEEHVVRNEDVVRRAAVDDETFGRVLDHERAALRAREHLLGARPPAVAGAAVVLVDDGLATGATARAAVDTVRAAGAARVVVAVPYGSHEACAATFAATDGLVCPWVPRAFTSVGGGYEDFDEVTDDEVRRLLAG